MVNKLVENTDSSKDLITDYTYSNISNSLINFINNKPASSKYALKKSDYNNLNISEDKKGINYNNNEGNP